ncbi:MAG TPA: hypothetical protein VEH27_05515 [Methylomirabilota bacterium]|nr:hypothetical protein [Methylomirabilota bacterium]
MSGWSFAASWPVILLGVVVFLGSLTLSAIHITRSRRAPRVIALEGLRTIVVAALVFTLLRPEHVRQVHRTNLPEVAILYDRSGSMETKDLLSSNAVLSRAEWLTNKARQEFWKPFEGKAKVLHLDMAAGGKTNAVVDGTDLATPLDQLLQRQDRLKAVLMLTDGSWNYGPNPIGPATRLREQEVPIFSVAVGREQQLPDIALENVLAPSYGLFGEQISIPFRVRNTLPTEAKITLELMATNREEARRELTLPPNSEISDAILWSPRAVGDVDLTLRFAPVREEKLVDNNAKNFRINVRVEKLNVLVIDSLPRWEYRFLRNALARDPGVEVNSILFHPNMGVGGGKGYLPAFPSSKDLISKYDVIFLGDVGLGEGELATKDLELIRGLVEQQGSGLVFLPGRRGRQLTLADSPLKDLMPVNLETNKPGVHVQNEGSLLLTATGKGHLLTRFDASENRNDELWKLLPGFFWSAAVERNRPGSEVLAVHSGLRTASGRMPLLVSRPFGSGKVVFMGSDSAWRWRRGVEDRYHYRFWSQVVRWMAHQRHLAARQGVRLTYSPETPKVNDPVFLQATVLDASGFPLEDKLVLGQITTPSGRSEALEFNAMEGGWGVFKTDYTPREFGAYKIAVGAEGNPRRLEATVEVTRPALEKLGQPVNMGLLKELADITKGAVAAPEKLEELVRQISLLPEPKPMERRLRLWSHPVWGGCLLLALAIYWTGRKLAGMV